MLEQTDSRANFDLQQPSQSPVIVIKMNQDWDPLDLYKLNVREDAPTAMITTRKYGD